MITGCTDGVTHECSASEVCPELLRNRPESRGYISLRVALNIQHLPSVVPVSGEQETVPVITVIPCKQHTHTHTQSHTPTHTHTHTHTHIHIQHTHHPVPWE